MARITRVAYVACMARVALVACVVRLISFVWLVCGLSNFFCTLDHVWKLLTCNALPVHLLRQVQKSMFFLVVFSLSFLVHFSSIFRRFFVDFGASNRCKARKEKTVMLYMFFLCFFGELFWRSTLKNRCFT